MKENSKLITNFLKLVPKVARDASSEEEEQKFADNIETLLSLEGEESDFIASQVLDNLPADLKSWFVSEVELSAEISFIETKSKLLSAVVFGVPLVFSGTEEIPEHLSDVQRWSLENSLKIHEAVSEHALFCRIDKRLFKPEEVMSLHVADVNKIADNLARQAAEFEDRVKVPDEYLYLNADAGLEPQSVFQARMLIGVAVLSEQYLEEVFLEEDMETEPEFSKELSQIFSFKNKENVALVGISLPRGYFEDCRRMEELLRETQFKGYLHSTLENAPEDANITVNITPTEENNDFLVEIIDTSDDVVILSGSWAVLFHETPQDALDLLVQSLNSYIQLFEFSKETKLWLETQNSLVH